MGKFFTFGNAKSYINSLYTVSKILDINLLEVENGIRINLVGVQPPSTASRDGIVFLEELVLHKRINVEYDNSRRDSDGNILGFGYLNCGKNFDKIKGVKIFEKYRPFLSGFEAPDEMEEKPENFYLYDEKGNKKINPDISIKMKPKGDLYLQLNLSLISCGFADFKSMPPDTCMDDLFKIKYQEAINKKVGIWS